MPAFSCHSTGEVLNAAAIAHPECRFTVLCIHTHGQGTARLAGNLVVHTQAAEYGQPGFVLVKIHSGGVEILK